jgi:parallel beta-helix repeat protein
MEKNQDIINQGLSGVPAEVSVRAFGVVGDGFADDTSALQRALDSGARRVIIPPGCFLIRRTLEPAAGQCVVIDGTIKIADAERSPLARDLRSGDRSVLVEDASGFQVGDTISIHDDKLPIQGGGRKVRRERAGHAKVLSIAGHELLLDRSAFRTFSPTANGFVARQNGAIWIRHSAVRLCGTGCLDGNWSNQLNAAPGFLDVDSSEVHPGASGVTVQGDGWLDGVIIEGITVRNFTLHGISLRQAELSIVRNVTVEAVHDKSIALWNCRDCRISGNLCRDSVFEDGIMLHQVKDPSNGCRRIFIEGNICRNNARYGIHVGAGMSEIHLANNLCSENGFNLSIYGDHCTSTADVASGTTDRLFLAAVYRPNVLLGGRHLSVTNLSAFGTRFVGVEICGQAIQLQGGLIGPMDAPVSCDEPGAKHPLLGEWGRGSGEFFIDGDCRIGIAIVPGLTGRGKTNIPADVMISNVSICGCRLDLEVSPQAERVETGKLIKLRDEECVQRGLSEI